MTCEYLINKRSKQLVSQILSIAFFMITISFSAAASNMTYNLRMGVRNLKCALTAGGESFWNLVAAAAWLAAQAQDLGVYDLYDMLQDYLNEYWPYACTCLNDVETIGEYIGADKNSTAEMSEC